MSKLALASAAIPFVLFLSACEEPTQEESPPGPAEQVAQRDDVYSRIDEEIEKALAVATNIEAPYPIGEARANADVLPPPQPISSMGGDLIVGYLEGRYTDEEVVSQFFLDPEEVFVTRTEMSMAIQQLREEGAIDAQAEEDLMALEGAMTLHLNNEVNEAQRHEAFIEYGSAAAVGLLSFTFADELADGGRYVLTKTAPVTAPLRDGFRHLMEALGGRVDRVKTWLSERPATEKATSALNRVMDRSHKLFLRTAGYARAGTLTGEQFVLHKLARVVGPERARNLRVSAVQGEEIDVARRLVYYPSKEKNIRIHERRENNYFYVKIRGPSGEFEYYKVDVLEDAVSDVAPDVLLASTHSRLASGVKDGIEFTTPSGKKLATGVSGAWYSRLLPSNPVARDILKRAAVGATLGTVTYLVVRPYDWRYFFLEDYVQVLQDEGFVIIDE